MGFDIAIYNGYSGDGNKVINSVKAAYLYADEVRVYDNLIPIGFNVDEIKKYNEEEKEYSIKYQVNDPYYLEVYELEDDGKIQKISDLNSKKYKEFLLLHGKYISRMEDRSYINECERIDLWRKKANSSYSALTYQEKMSKLGVKFILPANESRPDRNSLYELALQLPLVFMEDSGFKVLNQEPYNIETIVTSMLTPSALAEYTISTLPGFEEASIDEIKDIRRELDKYIIPYRAAMLNMAQTIKDIPDTESLQRECVTVYLREIEPKVHAINAAIKDNNVFMNIARSLITEKETWIAAGALVAGFSTTGDIASAISMGTAVALGGISISKGITETMEELRNIKKNEMYFLYGTTEKLRELKMNRDIEKNKELYNKYHIYY